MSTDGWTDSQRNGLFQSQSIMLQFLSICAESMDRLGLTRKALSKKMDVSASQISQWLDDDANLTIETMGEILAALEVRHVAFSGMCEATKRTSDITLKAAGSTWIKPDNLFAIKDFSVRNQGYLEPVHTSAVAGGLK